MGECQTRAERFAGRSGGLSNRPATVALDARAVLDLALLYDRTGRSEEARKEYEIVIQLQPENATALNNLAYLEAEEGVDLDQALAHAQRARQKLPGDLDVQDTLALVYIRKNLTNDGFACCAIWSPESRTAPRSICIWRWPCIKRATGGRPSASSKPPCVTNRARKEQNQIKELLAKIG